MTNALAASKQVGRPATGRKRVRFSASVPPELIAELQAIANRRDESLSAIVTKALRIGKAKL